MITSQPGAQLEPLTVRISLPPEEETDEEEEQRRMMGFEEDEEEEILSVRIQERNHARTRATPQVQRAQSELVPDRRAGSPGVVQRSMSESRG